MHFHQWAATVLHGYGTNHGLSDRSNRCSTHPLADCEDVSFSCWNRPCLSAAVIERLGSFRMCLSSIPTVARNKRTTRSVHRIFMSWPWNTPVFTTKNHKMPRLEPRCPSMSLDVQMASIDASTQILDQAGINGGGVLNDCWYMILNDDICWYYLMFRCSGSISLPSIGFRIMNHAERHQWSGANWSKRKSVAQKGVAKS